MKPKPQQSSAKKIPVRATRVAHPSPYIVHVRDAETAAFATPRVELIHTSLVEAHAPLHLTITDHALLLEQPAALSPRRNTGIVRRVVVFAAFASFLVMPLHASEQLTALRAKKQEIVAQGSQGMQHLLAAREALSDSPTAAAANFAAASESFASAKAVADVPALVLSLAGMFPEGRAAASGTAALQAAQALSAAAEGMTSALAASEGAEGFFAKLTALRDGLVAVQPQLTLAQASLAKVHAADLPADMPLPLDEVRGFVNRAVVLAEQFPKTYAALAVLAGEAAPQRYVVLFQNTNELRPTGGFMGSFALVTLFRGEVTNMEMPSGGTYDVQGQLTEQVLAPKPLGLVNARWEFQDANWFPDFPTSADKVRWFLDKSGWPSVDGVLAINLDAFEKLLALVGPVTLKDYGITVNAENFALTAQQIASRDSKGRDEKPKAYLGALFTEVMARLQELPQQDVLQAAGILAESLASKDIQIAVRDEAAATEFARLGWNGALAKTTEDYVGLFNANIGGGKTDRLISETVQDTTVITDDGSVEKTIIITREHHGDPGKVFEKDNNVTYHRLLVPHGAVLLSAHGLIPPPSAAYEKPEDYLRADKDLTATETLTSADMVASVDSGTHDMYTVFGGWSMVKPGQKAVLRFTYRLPFRVSIPDAKPWEELMKTPRVASFSTVYDMQSGTRRQVERTVLVPETWERVWDNEKAAFTLTHPTIMSSLYQAR